MPLRIKPKWITLILVLMASVLLGCSIPSIKFNIGFYGLIHSFPAVYFIGLGLLGISFILAIKSNANRRLIVPQLLIFIAALWFLPTLVGSHPGTPMAYRNLQLISEITNQGLGCIINNWYLSWPGFHVLFSSMGTNAESIINTFPFIIQLLCLPPLFIFLRNTLGADREKCCWVGVWIFYLGNWIGQDYFGPQALAFLLLLTILALTTHRTLWEGRTHNKLIITIASVTLFGILAVTHLLTSLAVLCLLGTYALVRKSPRVAITVCICFLMVLTWDVSYGGHFYARVIGSNLLVSTSPSVEGSPTDEIINRTAEGPGALTFDPEYILESNVLTSISGSDSHMAVVKTRIAYSVVFVLPGIIGAMFISLYRRTRQNIAVLAMALSLFLLLPLRYAGWELTQRIYMFELPFVAYFCAILWGTKRTGIKITLGLLIIVGTLPFFVCHYGNQAVDYWSQDYKAGYHYISDLQGNVGSLRDINLVDGKISFNRSHDYFAISKYDDTVYGYLYNRPHFVDSVWELLRESPNHVLIYRNPEVEVFKWKD